MQLSDETKEKIIELKQQGVSSRKIAKKLGCGKSSVNDYWKKYNENNTSTEVKKPKILLLDVENAASVGLVFGRFKQNLSQDHILTEGGWLLTYAYKWLGEPEIGYGEITPEEAIECNDARLCMELFDIMEQADVVIAHNSYGHDIPLLKARIIINGLPPLRKNKVIDTLFLSKEFKFNSKKLDSLCSALDIGRKIENGGIKLWADCQNGIQEAITQMRVYNVGDVELLEELYLAIRSHSTRHSNLAVYYNDNKIRCNICCSDEVESTGNLVTTNVSVFQEYKCKCGARFKNRQSITSKEQRSKFLSN